MTTGSESAVTVPEGVTSWEEWLATNPAVVFRYEPVENGGLHLVDSFGDPWCEALTEEGLEDPVSVREVDAGQFGEVCPECIDAANLDDENG